MLDADAGYAAAPIDRPTVEQIARELAAYVDGQTPQEIADAVIRLHVALGWNELVGCFECYGLHESGFINDDGICEDCEPDTEEEE